ncbi:hypothetical protein GN244_ATG01524 [Phytophthora infestans]|uniref:Uncharacterized protein n=1 Tax=Phytophthora infestans TaxID=4787 RepID=A0A833WPY1_PHYIN|nr:hypothetical protein GN244_ATG01524 [Phytophthora infestans]
MDDSVPNAQPETINQEVEQASHSTVQAAIADDPELVRFCLTMCKSTTGKRPAPPAEDRDSQRRRLTSPLDLLDLSSTPKRPAKHAFNPSRPQQAINRLLASPNHAGKSPSTLAEAMISSRATKFKPHPAIIARVYDFEFGRRGLSVMHFVRYDFAARRAWYANASVNLNNFAASVSLLTASKPQSLDDVSNALSVLHVFAEEVFDNGTCRLISCAREFIEELRSFCHWSAQDIATLTFWFDSIMEEYRAASEQDARLEARPATRLHQSCLYKTQICKVCYISSNLSVSLPCGLRQVLYGGHQTIRQSQAIRSAVPIQLVRSGKHPVRSSMLCHVKVDKACA